MKKGHSQSLRKFITDWGKTWLHHRAARMIGLAIGFGTIILVQMEKSGWKFSLTGFGFRSLAKDLVYDGAIVDRQGLGAELRDLVCESGLKGQPVVLSVSGPSVIVKRLTISGVLPTDLSEHFQWEGHRYISSSLDDVCLDHLLLGVNGERALDVLLVAVKRDLVEDLQVVATEAGLEPVGCDVDGLALTNMASLAGFNTYAPHLNIGMGLNGATIVGLDKGLPLFVKDAIWEDDCTEVPVGMETNLMGARPTSSESDRWGEQVGGTDVKKMAREIKRNLVDMSELCSGTKLDPILLSGHGVTHDFCQTVAAEVSMPVRLVNPFHSINIGGSGIDQAQVQRFGSMAGVAVGLAARNDCHS